MPAKNTPAISPRAATTVGMPRPPRKTPAGSNRRSAGTSTASAATAVTGAERGRGAAPAQLTAVTPSAAPAAAATRPRPVPAGGPDRRSRRTPGTTSASATTTNGTSPRNTQCHENCSVTSAATGGPISDGSTQAADINPNNAGAAPLRVHRRDRDVDRDELGPGAPALQDAADQELGHRAGGAGDDQPGGEHQGRESSAAPGPGDVAPAAAQHGAEHGRGEERGERPRVGRHGTEIGDHGGHRGADAHRLEGGDQGDQQHEPDGGGPPAGPEQRCPRRLGDVGRSGAGDRRGGFLMRPACNLDRAGQATSVSRRARVTRRRRRRTRTGGAVDDRSRYATACVAPSPRRVEYPPQRWSRAAGPRHPRQRLPAPPAPGRQRLAGTPKDEAMAAPPGPGPTPGVGRPAARGLALAALPGPPPPRPRPRPVAGEPVIVRLDPAATRTPPPTTPRPAAPRSGSSTTTSSPATPPCCRRAAARDRGRAGGRRRRPGRAGPSSAIAATPNPGDTAPWGLDRIDQRPPQLSGRYTPPAADRAAQGRHRVRDRLRDRGRPRRPRRPGAVGLHRRRRRPRHRRLRRARHPRRRHDRRRGLRGGAGAVALVAVRTLDCDGGGEISGVIAGIDWAARDHAAGTPRSRT